MNTSGATTDAPLGVFDSGIGGLSVLRALQAELPRERFVYFADGACTPYGPRGDAFVTARSLAITDYLVRDHGIKALVVACNTATAAAIQTLRARYSRLIIVGVEPALKPAAAATHTGHVGVLATQGTLASTKFAHLRAGLAARAHFTVQACAGLAETLEHSADGGPAADAAVATLCARYVEMLGPLGAAPNAIDTLVLGCTHYVFAEAVLQRLAGPAVRVLETGRPVARHTRHLLEQRGLLASDDASREPAARLLTSGEPRLLQAAADRWLAAAHAPAVQITLAESPSPTPSNAETGTAPPRTPQPSPTA